MLQLRKKDDKIEAGARFRRVLRHQVEEWAEVIAVRRDKMGIPHVCYRVRFERLKNKDASVDQRTLALSAFTQQFPERVLA